ncbi:tyrosine aminotransferase isoform X1 [Daphnia magna]|uniref:tyrosine aminotransferase isoform X1 n=2 Tax=Daphnia magna TaxID=35525 RepID=UPI0006E77F30|nr:tyrosine aminotransferase isoform X1 [Daphnia magna]
MRAVSSRCFSFASVNMKSRRSWSVTASDLARNTFNPIRTVVESMKLTPNPEKPMIALSIGDPTIFGNLCPSEEIVEAVVESVRSMKYNGYAPSTGYEEARNVVASYVSVPGATVEAKDIILCSGCSCALDLCISVLANPGQNILVPRPGFPLYRTLAEGLGIRTKFYDLKPENGWEVDLEQLEAQIDDQTAAIVLNNPSNPCGSVYSRSHLNAILQVAARNFVPIIADEIYDYFVFPGHEFHPLASLTNEVPILTCGGLTKRYLIPGWRMGWIVVHDRNEALSSEVRKGLQSLSQRIIGSSTILQGALSRILTQTPPEFFQSTIAQVYDNARLAHQLLSGLPGMRPIMPSGAMYMMVGVDMTNFPEFENDLQFVERMVTEESVFCLPGRCFDYPNYFRIVLTVPELQLREACHRISQFCTAHYVAPLTLGKEEPLSNGHIHHELHNGIVTVIEP